MWAKIIAVLCAIFLFSLPCAALGEEIADEYGNMMDAIPDDVADLLPDSFFDGIDGAAEGLGEVLEPSFWGKLLKQLFLDGIKESAPTLLSLFGLVILAALLSVFRDAFKSEALSGAVTLAVAAVCVSVLVSSAAAHITAVSEYVSRLSTLCISMLPVLGGVLAMGGSGGAAVATHGGFLMILGIIEAVVGQAFGAIAGTSLAFSAANIFSGKFRLSALSRAVRRCFGVFFGSVTALLGFILSIKIGIAAAGDSVAMRASKIFASNAIPLVGSAVGDSLKTLAAALSYIKSISGAVGIALILLLALPVFFNIWLFRSGLVLISGAAEMLGCDRERELLSGVISVYGYMLAVIALCSVVFILMLTLFMKTALAFGGGI